MQGTKLSLQEKECKLYDEFDKFSFVKGETLYQYYCRFAQLINNMNVINMSMRPVQVNTKFLTSLPPEWSKFMTDVKLVRDLHTTNNDQLYSYLKQHETHANETRLMRERYQDPLAFLLQGSLQPTINLELPLIRETRPLFKTTRLLCNKFKGGKDKVMQVTWLGNALSRRGLGRLHDLGIPCGQGALTTIPNTVAFQTEDLDAYDSDCDDVSNAKAVLMTNLSNYGSDVISEEKLALKQQIDSLEQNLSNQIKEKEFLLQTFIVFKNESKEKESKYMDKEFDLEKKIKELDNIVYKVGQSAQTAQRIKPTLYDGSVISSQHAASPVIDDEETLILEELNRLSEDFGKRFVPQQELSDEQAFWLQTSHPNTDQYAS
ncbi:hypothetical protein Tco_0100033 [Tanacetum coccineum]